ncbi:unnamed protein product [Zymoseptoria tritici ST99CH_1A5]|uniref:DUF2470 domain-containing protein n=1 Tax=Zymoseptoria tritici ST99CH_1A5 TaxID=1276529 RepID=A0A1Y6L8E3_ZYMTR|nr:unnamed protein product [Zymoseptoria tritici ST99CH_3D1]SMY19879.1 unnamed protein product [Zymoseptoria tritici ST99CH_1A5]
MSDSSAQDEAIKARIIKHMNEQHRDSIARYLENYAKLSSFSAYDGILTDIDLGGLTLSCHGRSHRIPLEPPMKSYREARERVVQLDKECCQQLNRSDVTVKEYRSPQGFDALVFMVVSATLLAYSQRWWFEKGQVVEAILGSSFARFSWTIQPWLFWFMVALHGAETIYFASAQLSKHSVSARSRIWWLWTGSVFIEGVFAMKRFSAMVTAQREKQKH